MARRGAYRTFTTAGVAQALVIANGSYPLKIPSGPAAADLIDWQGGTGAFEVMGTFDSASVQLQLLGMDAATWLSVGSPVTAAGLVNFTLPAGQLRVTVSSIVTAASLTIGAVGVPTNNGG